MSVHPEVCQKCGKFIMPKEKKILLVNNSYGGTTYICNECATKYFKQMERDAVSVFAKLKEGSPTQ